MSQEVILWNGDTLDPKLLHQTVVHVGENILYGSLADKFEIIILQRSDSQTIEPDRRVAAGILVRLMRNFYHYEPADLDFPAGQNHTGRTCVSDVPFAYGAYDNAGVVRKLEFSSSTPTSIFVRMRKLKLNQPTVLFGSATITQVHTNLHAALNPVTPTVEFGLAPSTEVVVTYPHDVQGFNFNTVTAQDKQDLFDATLAGVGSNNAVFMPIAGVGSAQTNWNTIYQPVLPPGLGQFGGNTAANSIQATLEMSAFYPLIQSLPSESQVIPMDVIIGLDYSGSVGGSATNTSVGGYVTFLTAFFAKFPVDPISGLLPITVYVKAYGGTAIVDGNGDPLPGAAPPTSSFFTRDPAVIQAEIFDKIPLWSTAGGTEYTIWGADMVALLRSDPSRTSGVGRQVHMLIGDGVGEAYNQSTRILILEGGSLSGSDRAIITPIFSSFLGPVNSSWSTAMESGAINPGLQNLGVINGIYDSSQNMNRISLAITSSQAVANFNITMQNGIAS